MTEDQAIELWNTKVINDKLVMDALCDETGYGVCLGFFLGCGFSLNKSVELAKKVKY